MNLNGDISHRSGRCFGRRITAVAVIRWITRNANTVIRAYRSMPKASRTPTTETAVSVRIPPYGEPDFSRLRPNHVGKTPSRPSCRMSRESEVNTALIVVAEANSAPRLMKVTTPSGRYVAAESATAAGDSPAVCQSMVPVSTPVTPT